MAKNKVWRVLGRECRSNGRVRKMLISYLIGGVIVPKVVYQWQRHWLEITISSNAYNDKVYKMYDSSVGLNLEGVFTDCQLLNILSECYPDKLSWQRKSIESIYDTDEVRAIENILFCDHGRRRDTYAKVAKQR